MESLDIGFVGNVPKPFGGVATFCYHLTSKLLAEGHNVSFYDTYYHSRKSPPSNLNHYVVAKKGMSIHSIYVILAVLLQAFFNKKLRVFIKNLLVDLYHARVPYISMKMSILVIVRSFDMWRFFKDKQVDIFHGQHASFDTFAVLMLSKHYFKCPCLVTVYASEFTMSQNRQFLPLAKYVCTNCDGVMSISQYTHQQMKNARVNPKIYSVIYLGVDPIHFSPSNYIPNAFHAIKNSENSSTIILYVGWLIERKGPQILLEGLSQLEDLSWQAIFIGPDHGLASFLNQRAEELNLASRIKIMTDVPYEDLLAAYDLANIFVFPTLSRDEGFGLVALEAMAHGLPVIASKIGAIPETVVDGETGLFFAPGDFKGLAVQLERLLTDVELRSKMGVNASQRAKEKYSWDKTATQVVSLYRSLIQNMYRS